MGTIENYQFQGVRTDLGDKLLNPKYFYDVVNFNQDSIVGANKVLAPAEVNKREYAEQCAVDGIFGYIYVDENNKTLNEEIVVSGGKIFKDFQRGIEIYSGLTPALCDFVTHMDCLFITNGKDNIKIYNGKTVIDMGALEATVQDHNGGADGEYWYEVTFVTDGGEERTGAKSNKISVERKSVLLNLPIGYAGANARKIYRAHVGSENFKLVATINDNETLALIDNLADSQLTTNIPKEITNPFPKPYFLETQNFKLFACVSDEYPTQSWVGDINVKMFDMANFLDISNRSKDNSPLVGMKKDYDKIIVASQKQVYLVDLNNQTPQVVETRSNIGCLAGRSMARVPKQGDFPGGILFLASDKTIRLFNGNYAGPQPTSLDNLNTDDFGQPIRKFFNATLNKKTLISSEYFDFKYHLIVDNIILVFDIRTQSWFKYDFSDAVLMNGFYDEEFFDSDFFITALPTRANYSCFGVVNEKFYVGRQDCSFVEMMYKDNFYRGSEIKSRLEFPYWGNDSLKTLKEIYIYFEETSEIDFDVYIKLDVAKEPYKYHLSDKTGGFYDQRCYSETFFQAGQVTENYRVIQLNEYANWVKVIIESNKSTFNFRGMKIVYEEISNKELK